MFCCVWGPGCKLCLAGHIFVCGCVSVFRVAFLVFSLCLGVFFCVCLCSYVVPTIQAYVWLCLGLRFLCSVCGCVLKGEGRDPEDKAVPHPRHGLLAAGLAPV